MKQNVHVIDRIARLVLGVALLAFFILSNSEYKVFGLVGFIPLVTGMVGFCPLYSLLGVDGCACKKTAS